MSGSDAVILRNWLKQRRRPPSPIANEVQRVNEQAQELRRVVEQLKQAAHINGHKP